MLWEHIVATERVLIKCAHCKADFFKALRTIRKYEKLGRKDFYCSRACVALGVAKKLRKPRAKLVSRKCPVCKESFTVKKSSPKVTCSYACSNTYFRSGEENGNWSNNSYTAICFLWHKKKCVCCNEKLIVAVHHFDNDRRNNDPRNLVPLCPTHHTYLHSSYANLVLPKVVAYVKAFRLKFKRR